MFCLFENVILELIVIVRMFQRISRLNRLTAQAGEPLGNANT